MSQEITKEEFFARVRQQMKEVQQLREEYVELSKMLDEKSKPSDELISLQEEIESLKKELKEVNEEAAKVPEKYRMKKEKVHKHMNHPDQSERLFDDKKSKSDKKNGRIKLVKDPKEFICHPLPNEIPQKCKTGPVVIARVTCEFNN